MPTYPTAATPISERSQLGVILTLFVILRLSLLLLWSPQGLFTNYTDYYSYFRAAQLSEQGFYPYINMWSVYPPLSAYLPQLAYGLARIGLSVGDMGSFGYQLYLRLLGSLMLVIESGCLILLHQIAARVWGVSQANWLAWIYSSLSLPLFYWLFAHQDLTTFFLLLAIYWFVTDHHLGSAIAVGLGIVAKLMPIFLLAPAIKFLWPRHRKWLTYTAALVYLPFFLLGGGPWVAASFKSLLLRNSWATPWAMLDNNWVSGDVGGLAVKLSVEQAGARLGHSALIPGWATLGIFALGYALVFFRPARREARHFIWFATLTAMGLHLWSKGWSPQFAATLIPLILLSFPDRHGLELTLVLTAMVFIEWPLAEVFKSPPLLSIAIIGRSAVLVAVAFLAGQQLWGTAPHWLRRRRPAEVNGDLPSSAPHTERAQPL